MDISDIPTDGPDIAPIAPIVPGCLPPDVLDFPALPAYCVCEFAYLLSVYIDVCVCMCLCVCVCVCVACYV
jgi:hypothetical protein